MTTNPILWSAVAFFLGAPFIWLYREREVTALGTGLAAEKLHCAELVALLSRAETDLGDERCAVAAANERVSTLRQAEERMRGDFGVLAQGALDTASARFLDLATVRLAPVHDEFAKFTTAVNALQTSLHEAVRTTSDATGQLRVALQNPRVAGNWGEMSLERIVELAGMTDHVDFDRQTGVRSSDGTGERPTSSFT
ncbi:MAG: DNA recombination protein RmuC [Candidatus Cybelea sp.]